MEKHKIIRAILRLVWIIPFLILWHCASFLSKLSIGLPKPIEVLSYYFSWSNLSVIIVYSWRTLSTLTLCLLIAIPIGYTIGIITGRWFYVRCLVTPPLDAIRSVPMTAFLPLYLLLFGLSHYLVFLVSTPLIAILAINTADAYLRISRNRNQLIKLFDIPYHCYFRHVVFWETLEVVFATVRIAVSYGLAILVALDFFLSSNNGLGAYISQHYYSYNATKYIATYAGILWVGFIGILLTSLVNFIANFLLVWKKDY